MPSTKTRKAVRNPLSREKRSNIMRAIRAKNTGPERYVRSLLHRLGYRFQIHVKVLPGTPDIVFTKRRKVIFVHGCFWHQHHDPNCRAGHPPRSNTDYWQPKLARNVSRDKQNLNDLKKARWEVLVIWECEIGGEVELERSVCRFLGQPRAGSRRTS